MHLKVHHLHHLKHQSQDQVLNFAFCGESAWIDLDCKPANLDDPFDRLPQDLLSVYDDNQTFDGFSFHSESTHPRTSSGKLRPQNVSWRFTEVEAGRGYVHIYICCHICIALSF